MITCPHAYCDAEHIRIPHPAVDYTLTYLPEFGASPFSVYEYDVSPTRNIKKNVSPAQSSNYLRLSPLSFGSDSESSEEDFSSVENSDAASEYRETAVLPHGTSVEIREFDWSRFGWGPWVQGSVICYTPAGVVGCTITELYAVRTEKSILWVSPGSGALRDGKHYIPSGGVQDALLSALVYAYIPEYNPHGQNSQVDGAIWVPAFLTGVTIGTQHEVIPLIRSLLITSGGPVHKFASDLAPYQGGAGADAIMQRGGRVQPDRVLHPVQYMAVEEILRYFE